MNVRRVREHRRRKPKGGTTSVREHTRHIEEDERLKNIRAVDRERGRNEYEEHFNIGYEDGQNNTDENEPKGHGTTDAELEGYYHGLQAGREERERHPPKPSTGGYEKEGKELNRLKGNALGTSKEWKRYAQGRAAGETALERQLKAGGRYWDIYRYLHGNLEGAKNIKDTDHQIRKERRAFLVGESEVMYEYLRDQELSGSEEQNRIAHSKMVEQRWKDERKYKCPYYSCKRRFPSQSNLEHHMKSDHNYPSPYS